MAIVLTSTTSSQEEMNRVVSAEGDGWRKPPVIEESKPDVEETTVDAHESGDSESPKEADKGTEKGGAKPKEHHKSTPKQQARFDDLTKRRHEAEVKAEQERMGRQADNEAKDKEIAELKARLNGQPAKPEVDIMGAEPTWEDSQARGETVKQYAARLNAWNNAQEIRKEQQERVKEWEGDLARATAAYSLAEKEYIAKNPEYTKLVDSAPVKLSQFVIDALYFVGNPEVTSHLLKNPELVKEINRMHPNQGANRVYQLAREVSEKQTAAPRPKVKPPEPIAPVGASATRQSIPLDQLPPREYNRVRDAEEARNKRRR